MRHLAIVITCLALCLSATDGAAQARPNNELTRVTVRTADRAGVLKGRLIALGPEGVRVRVKDQEISIPLDRVVEVRKDADSVGDGFLKGALLGAVVCLLGCAQGAESPAQVPLVVAGGMLGYGGIGALIDWAHPNKELLFPQP